MPHNNELFCDIIARYQQSKEWLELELSRYNFERFKDIGADSYDGSIEFYDVADDDRLSEGAQKFLHNEGFTRAYLNHLNGIETVYSLLADPINYRSWRVDRTRLLMSYLPESWKGYSNGYTVKEDL
jgi:hypothetical protein